MAGYPDLAFGQYSGSLCCHQHSAANHVGVELSPAEQASFDLVVAGWELQPSPEMSVSDLPTLQAFNFDLEDVPYNCGKEPDMNTPMPHNPWSSSDLNSPSDLGNQLITRRGELSGEKGPVPTKVVGPDFTFDLTSMHPNCGATTPSLDELDTTSFYDDIPLQGTESPRSSMTHKLTDLSVELADFSETIPPLTIHNYPGGLVGMPPDILSMVKRFRNDAVLNLSERLIDSYSKLLRSDSVGHALDRPNSLTIADRTSDWARSIDHASIHLLLSCHHRLIDAYDRLLLHARICFRSTVDESCQFAMEPVRIGNFAASENTALAMMYVMLAKFGVNLKDKSYELMSRVGAKRALPAELEPAGSMCDHEKQEQVTRSNDIIEATALACKAVWHRASGMLRKIYDLRNQTDPAIFRGF